MWPEGEKERVVEFTSDAIKALEKVLQQIEGGAEPIDPTYSQRYAQQSRPFRGPMKRRQRLRSLCGWCGL